MQFSPDHEAQPVFYVLLSLGIKHVDQSGQMLVLSSTPLLFKYLGGVSWVHHS